MKLRQFTITAIPTSETPTAVLQHSHSTRNIAKPREKRVLLRRNAYNASFRPVFQRYAWGIVFRTFAIIFAVWTAQNRAPRPFFRFLLRSRPSSHKSCAKLITICYKLALTDNLLSDEPPTQTKPQCRHNQSQPHCDYLPYDRCRSFECHFRSLFPVSLVSSQIRQTSLIHHEH